MEVKGVLYEDYVNYKKPSMTVLFPTCSFKCDKECGKPVCQNSELASAQSINIPVEHLLEEYLCNPFTSAIVISGLEPLDSELDLIDFIQMIRDTIYDDIVIYTGYTEDEIPNTIKELQKFPNIYMKFGRFIPGHEKHYDSVLGVYLASDNQYGKRIS